MLTGCPELEAQKNTLSQFWKLKIDTLCQSWNLKNAPCPAIPSTPRYESKVPPPPRGVDRIHILTYKDGSRTEKVNRGHSVPTHQSSGKCQGAAQ